MSKYFLGIGKTLFNSSACLIEESESGLEIEHILNERVTRTKASGAWPTAPLERLKVSSKDISKIAENRDVHLPSEVERVLNDNFPFYEMIESKNLEMCSTHFNSSIEVLPHHYTHAIAATSVSPFNQSIIVVRDGAGSRYQDFQDLWRDHHMSETDFDNEECTVFLQNGSSLKEVKKYWQTFSRSNNHPTHHFSRGLGTLYEKVAEFIFSSKRAAGKVMGLASFGTPEKIDDPMQFLENLDWNKSYTGSSKSEWEESPYMDYYCNIAASVQLYFENQTLTLLQELKKEFPQYNNLILTGGCALNCSTNAKIIEEDIYQHVYVPPFPGDECIGFGCASHLLYSSDDISWRPFPHENQHGYFGPKSSIPTDKVIEEVFESYSFTKHDDISSFTAGLIADGKVIAWFQGRSESGPRALGNRSILARPDQKGIKNYLNSNIKFRESFRPYGCSCLHDYANEYFNIPLEFDNPYMSFATHVSSNYQSKLKEVSHIDGTSRMQTVREGQNQLFYNLIQKVGDLTGIYCVLNTSLNIMGDPIVETVEDARDFLNKSNVDGLIIGSYFVTK